MVAIQTWDERAHRRHATAWPDFERWRDTLRSVEDVGAFHAVPRRLEVSGTEESVSVAEMTASGFRLARVPPLLGRPLVEQDERPTADPVVVIGYEIWQERFAADPDAGRGSHQESEPGSLQPRGRRLLRRLRRPAPGRPRLRHR